MTGADERTFDLDAVREVARDCDFTLPEFVAFFLGHSAKDLERVAGALEAGQLSEAERFAHGAKGASASARLEGLADRWRAVEDAARDRDLETAREAFVAARSAYEQVRHDLEVVVAQE